MRTVTIRECAFKACKAIGYGGSDLLMDALRIAFDGDENDDDGHTSKENAVLQAIVPDIKASVRDEDQFPPAPGGALAIKAILGTLGSHGRCDAEGCGHAKSDTAHEDRGE